jgi:hypothetical protein
LKEVIFFNILLFLLIAFFIKKKKLHPFENIFLLFVLEFIITGYVGILQINLQVWEISEKVNLYLIFRLNEVIVTPLLYIWYLNLMGSRKRNILEGFKISAVFVSRIYSLEFLLIKWNVIVYKNWNTWQPLFIISFIMVLSYFLLLSFRKLLSKEGVIV